MSTPALLQQAFNRFPQSGTELPSDLHVWAFWLFLLFWFTSFFAIRISYSQRESAVRETLCSTRLEGAWSVLDYIWV